MSDSPAVLPERPAGVALEHRKPVIDQMDERYLALVKSTRLKGLSPGELGMALELAAHYDLDPFTGEIWATRSEGRNGREGQLLIMVGRDGLRKVVMRNKLEMDGDVVRKKDTFRVTRNEKRERTIFHEYEGDVEDRGEIVGAWAEVWDRDGKQRGFFYAPVGEYRPTSENKLKYSPWGSQESVMILAAAERQAARQATPLSGLLMEGETDLNDERVIDASTAEDDAAVQAIIDTLDAEEELRDRLYDAIQEGNRLAPNSYPAMKVQMLVAGKTAEELVAEVEEIERLNAEHEERAHRRAAKEAEAAAAADPPEAEVVEEPAAAAEDDRRRQLENEVADLDAALVDADDNPAAREQLIEQLRAAQAELDELTGGE